MRDTAVADTSPSSASTLWRAAIRQLSVKGLRRTPPIWREGRALPELVALRRDPIASGVGLPAGHGRPVFLIPGYMAGDASLAPLAKALLGKRLDDEVPVALPGGERRFAIVAIRYGVQP